MNRSNFFIVNTPFQLYVVRCIINQYFKSSQFKNCIITTFKPKDSVDVMMVRRGIIGLIDIWRIKKVITKNINNAYFFIPHMNNLLSPYLWNLSLKYDRQISVYYEGVALFYNPIVRTNWMILLKRYSVSVLLRLKYRNYNQLFPNELCKKAYCYTPIEEYCKKFVLTYRFSLQFVSLNKENNLLLILSPSLKEEDVISIKKNILLYLGNHQCRLIYVKPHLQSSMNMVQMLCSELSLSIDCKIVLLNKKMPIECLYSKISFTAIISQHFSSVLINVRLLYGNDVDIILLSEIKQNELLAIAQSLSIV